MKHISYNDFIDVRFVTKVSIWIKTSITHNFPKTKNKWLSLLRNQFRKCKVTKGEITFKNFKYKYGGYFFVNETYLFKRLVAYGILSVNRNKVTINKRYYKDSYKRKSTTETTVKNVHGKKRTRC
tara:strand:+ start:56 stop:430 length:375 start_codon:yes stop_codon:yes gene_type:complete